MNALLLLVGTYFIKRYSLNCGLTLDTTKLIFNYH